MEVVDVEEAKAVFNDLKKSIEVFYSKYSELDTNGTIDMKDILLNCSKMEHFLNGEFYNLWQMEQEERRALARKLEEVGVVCCKADYKTEVTNERSVSCDSMPPLITPDEVSSQPLICEPTEAPTPPELPVYNPKGYEDIIYPLYTPQAMALQASWSNSLWGSWSNPSVASALAFNKSVMSR